MAVDIDQSHYNTGTATVAGTTVTGQGTSWLGAVRKGDLFGTHKGCGVRIVSVNSNTSITLAYAVTALNQTTAVYEIQRTPFDVGYLKAIEDMITLYGNGNLPSLAGLAGLGGDKGLMLAGVGTAVTYPLTAFARTLLDDASGATMYATLGAIPSAQLPARLGESAGETIPGGNYNLALKNGTYNGAGAGAVNGPPGSLLPYAPLVVSNGGGNFIEQMVTFGIGAGEVTAAIRGTNNGGTTFSAWKLITVERGSNANGSYVRHPDGTQKCWFTYNIAVLTVGAYATVSGTFPAAFSTQTDLMVLCSVSAVNTGPTSSFQRIVDTSPTSWNALATQNVVGTLTFDAMAVGRWF